MLCVLLNYVIVNMLVPLVSRSYLWISCAWPSRISRDSGRMLRPVPVRGIFGVSVTINQHTNKQTIIKHSYKQTVEKYLPVKH